jgi:hypothetical protein
MRSGGMVHWWNTTGHVQLDNRYSDNIAARVAYDNRSGDELLRAEHLRQFQKKRTELAWALLHVATQDRVFPYYASNSSIKHSKSDSKDCSQEIL